MGNRKIEAEGRPRPFARDMAQLSAVGGDDGSADGKAEPHAAIFGCGEGLEQLLQVRRPHADPGIFKVDSKTDSALLACPQADADCDLSGVGEFL